jgi:acyl-CoA synthetase (AMP-forming)/AMP-acid ligase II
MNGLVRSFAVDFAGLVSRLGANPAMIDARFGRAYSYADLGAMVARGRSLLEDEGLRPGHVVLSLLPNSSEAIVTFLASLSAGINYAPLPPDATLREVERAILLLKPRACIAGDSVSPEIANALQAAGVRMLRVPVDGTLAWLPEFRPGPLPKLAQAARLYLSTSGSTGEPKAIVIDVDRLWSSGRAFIGRHRFADETSRFYNILPVSYLGGLFNLCLIPLAAGGSFVIAEAFSGRSMLGFWQGVEQHGVNVLWVVPSMIRALLSVSDRTKRNKTTAPNLRGCLLGTASIDLETKQRFERFVGVPVLENFALSETTFLTSELFDDGMERSPGSVGPVLPYVSLCFVPIARGEDDEQPTEAPTEIRVKTPFLFLGYLAEDGTITLPTDQDGYFPTGDLGHLVDGSVLVLDGRLREVIKKGGFFVPLREIEILAETHEAIDEAAAVGITHGFYGESYRLFVRLKRGYQTAEAVSQFGSWLRSRIVRHKWPDGILVRDQFPRTTSGKVRKHLLAESTPHDG